ncbi:ribonuclease P protein subunit [Candidatus Woesearchaeota archaeon]|nr:ribonuclease P protein subunit [Candidatus Woesearchaeota archaeon]
MKLVGEIAIITQADNKEQHGIRGKIIDETRNTIRIATKEGIKTVIKEQVMLTIQDRTINGKQLTGRIEERIKSSR